MKNIDYLILKKVSENLLKRDEKIAVVESVTAGGLQSAFSQMPKASESFQGGMTTYTAESKITLLNIDAQEAEKFDCVSQNIAEKMAKNILKYFDVDWSIAITGYSTPVPESHQKLFAFYAIAYKSKIISSQRVELQNNLSDLDAKEIYIKIMLNDFLQHLRTENQ